MIGKSKKVDVASRKVNEKKKLVGENRTEPEKVPSVVEEVAAEPNKSLRRVGKIRHKVGKTAGGSRKVDVRSGKSTAWPVKADVGSRKFDGGGYGGPLSLTANQNHRQKCRFVYSQ